jgi:hypothetical protein
LVYSYQFAVFYSKEYRSPCSENTLLSWKIQENADYQNHGSNSARYLYIALGLAIQENLDLFLLPNFKIMSINIFSSKEEDITSSITLMISCFLYCLGQSFKSNTVPLYYSFFVFTFERCNEIKLVSIA